MTRFDEYQRALRDRDWTWADVPFYRRGEKLDLGPLHDLDYRDIYERIYGRSIGANGIGRLREVALLPAADGGQAEQQEQYSELLRRNGVTVHWIESPRATDGTGAAAGEVPCAAGDLLVVNGGAIVPRAAAQPPDSVTAHPLSQWAFWELNIPTLVTVTGSGVAEVGSTVWLAEDLFVTGRSPAFNREGANQFVPTVVRTARAPHVRVLTIRCMGDAYFDTRSGASALVSNIIAPLSAGKVLCHTPGVDTASLLWLKRHGYQIIEADVEEQIAGFACNLEILDDGVVVMSADAPRTIDIVRRTGVEVLAVPYSEFHRAGLGIARSTMDIYREPGPAHFSAPGAEPGSM